MYGSALTFSAFLHNNKNIVHKPGNHKKVIDQEKVRPYIPTKPPPPSRVTSSAKQYIDLILVQCWASVVDVGPTFKQHWVNVSCLLVPLPGVLDVGIPASGSQWDPSRIIWILSSQMTSILQGRRSHGMDNSSICTVHSLIYIYLFVIFSYGIQKSYSQKFKSNRL